MHTSSYSLFRVGRGLAYLTILLFVAMVGAHGERTTSTVHIGLRTQQPTVGLQGTVPVDVTSADGTSVNVPADKTLTFSLSNGGIMLTDDSGATLLTSNQSVQIKPSQSDTPTDDANPPLIRLLGATKHYDKRGDRPYRGYFELQPRPNGITVVNVVDLEQYLLGVVSSEMSPNYPVEALKAQAVAARTYALKNVGHYTDQGFDMDDTPRCQVYGGYFSEDPRTTQAVNATAGQVLTYHGDLIDALYSSNCGGITEDANDALGHDVPYLKSVPDYTDMKILPTAPKTEDDWATYFKSAKPLVCLQPKYARVDAFRWVKLITRTELEANLPSEYRVGTVKAIVPVKRGKSGRITALRIDGTLRSVVIEKELGIRNALGGNKNVKSSAFTIDTYSDSNGTPVVFALWGAGWGHGLGMCQVGAVGLAEQGWTYEQILHHYYTGIDIQR